MILAAHGLCEPVRTEARHFLKGETRTGGDDKVVITQLLAVIERELGMFCVDLSDGINEPIDTFAIERPLHRHLSLLGRAPTDRDPGVRRRELEIRTRADKGD